MSHLLCAILGVLAGGAGGLVVVVLHKCVGPAPLPSGQAVGLRIVTGKPTEQSKE